MIDKFFKVMIVLEIIFGFLIACGVVALVGLAIKLLWGLL